MKKERRRVHGVLVVDKPPGMTSHDVVARARRALETREVGHAGTLDPMATGVLVLAIGEGTKLVPYLTADDKAYDATMRLGVETDSLDADGVVTRETAVPAIDLEAMRTVAARFVGEIAQRVPSVSAIKIDGERMHALHRRGEVVEAPVRDVVVRALRIDAIEGADVRFHVACGKGLYVRALARDLAAEIGTVAHLIALRRVASGRFETAHALAFEEVERAAGGDADARSRVLGSLMTLRDAWGEGRVKAVDDAAEVDLRHGRAIEKSRMASLEEGEIAAVAGPHGHIVALVRREGDRVRVVRGIDDR